MAGPLIAAKPLIAGIAGVATRYGVKKGVKKLTKKINKPKPGNKLTGKETKVYKQIKKGLNWRHNTINQEGVSMSRIKKAAKTLVKDYRKKK